MAKLASLAQKICTLWFHFLVNSLLPKDTLLGTYLIISIICIQEHKWCWRCLITDVVKSCTKYNVLAYLDSGPLILI